MMMVRLSEELFPPPTTSGLLHNMTGICLFHLIWKTVPCHFQGLGLNSLANGMILMNLFVEDQYLPTSC